MQPQDFEKTIERLRAELEDSRKRENRLRAFLESASQAVVAVEDHGGIVLVNAATEELFGYSRQELIGSPLELLLPERLRDHHGHHRSSYFVAPRSRPMGDRK